MTDKKIKHLNQEILHCKKCPLYKSRTRAVPGEGNLKAEIMLIGEGPGRNEDKQGKPFVGEAGKFLEKMLNSIELKREAVFITNIVKCRPPANRDPKPEEVSACWPYLESQIKIINPKLIVALGKHSLDKFLRGQKISQIHGKLKRIEIPPLGKIFIYASYHPAAALYRVTLAQDLKNDFKKIPKALKKIKEILGKEK